MDPKLYMLFLLIGAIVGLSHLGDANLGKMKRRIARWRRREIGLRRRKS